MGVNDRHLYNSGYYSDTDFSFCFCEKCVSFIYIKLNVSYGFIVFLPTLISGHMWLSERPGWCQKYKTGYPFESEN